jgi:hypothetical protein
MGPGLRQGDDGMGRLLLNFKISLDYSVNQNYIRAIPCRLRGGS